MVEPLTLQPLQRLKQLLFNARADAADAAALEAAIAAVKGQHMRQWLEDRGVGVMRLGGDFWWINRGCIPLGADRDALCSAEWAHPHGFDTADAAREAAAQALGYPWLGEEEENR